MPNYHVVSDAVYHLVSYTHEEVVTFLQGWHNPGVNINPSQAT
jgi:hypothetical protein